MNVNSLELKSFDFSGSSPIRWRIRRIFIGGYLFTIYMYAIMFAILAQTGELELNAPPPADRGVSQQQIAESPPGANQPNDVEAAKPAAQQQQQPPPPPPGERAAEPKEEAKTKTEPTPAAPEDSLSTLAGLLPSTHLQIMLLFGALGAVFMVTRTFVRTVGMVDLPVVWYVTRPFQGALMSVFIYLAFLAGQVVFYSGTGAAVDPSEINIYTISVIAIVAGMFTDQAYDRLRKIADRALSSEEADTEDEGRQAQT